MFDFARPARLAIATLAAAAVCSGAGPAVAVGAVDQDVASIQSQIQEAEAPSDYGRDSVAQSFDGSAGAKAKVRSLVEPTLDLSDGLAAGPALPDQSAVLGPMPRVEASAVGISMPAPAGATGELSITLDDSHAVRTAGGVTEGAGPVATQAFAHITEREGGQIVAVMDADSPAKSLDFTVELPVGMSLTSSTDGALNIIDVAGQPVGTIKKPWAVDSTGKDLPTRYEVNEDGFRQHVDRSAATGAVALDPTVWWWAATVGKCAVEVAPVVASAGVLAGAKATRVIAKINDAVKKSAAVKKAVAAVGGVKNAATALFKKAYVTFKDKLPSIVKGKLPTISLTAQQAAAGGVLLGWIGNQFWDLIGFGSCSALVKEVM